MRLDFLYRAIPHVSSTVHGPPFKQKPSTVHSPQSTVTTRTVYWFLSFTVDCGLWTVDHVWRVKDLCHIAGSALARGQMISKSVAPSAPSPPRFATRLVSTWPKIGMPSRPATNS